MNLLDVRTVIFSHVLTDILGTIVIAGLWHQNRKRFTGTGFWVLDFLCQAVATLLIISRFSIPLWMSTVVANTLVIAGALLGYMGLQRFVGRVGSQVHNYALLAAFVVVHSYFLFVQPSLEARTLNVSVGLIVICFECTWLMLFQVKSAIRPITRGVGLVFAAFVLVSLLRIVLMLASPQANNDFFKSGLFDTLTLLTYQMLLILLAYALTLMVNQRLLVDLQDQHEELKDISVHDGLTGLYNRRFFEEEMARLGRGRRSSVSVVMADLDHLKAVNDRDGHAAGDVLLQRAARTLTAAFRGDDILARIGGDEFAVLLPNTDSATAQALLDRVRAAVSEHNAAHLGSPLSIALGASTAHQGTALTKALEQADASMYADKRGTA